MGRRTENEARPVALTDDQVASFLKANPDFLVRHPDIATRLAPPERSYGDGVADLQVFMIERLRQNLEEMRGCAEHLISTTRNNMSTQARTHQAVLAVLAAEGMVELARVVSDELPAMLEVDAAALCFEMGDHPVRRLAVPGIGRLRAGAVAATMGDDAREVQLKAATDGDPAIFGGAATLVRSFALVRLKPGVICPPGLLALGCRGERTFHPKQGTELLTFLARVVEHAVRRWLD